MSRKFLQGIIVALRDDLAAHLTKDLRGSEAAHCARRIRKLFDYTMGEGKLARSCLALDTYKALKPSTSSDELTRAGEVAVTVELLQSFLLVIDDIMDHSKMRRGKGCWYTMPGIGLAAINDGLVLDCSIDWVVRRAIPEQPRLDSLLKCIYEAKRKTVIGQMLDCGTGTNVEEFTWERYQKVGGGIGYCRRRAQQHFQKFQIVEHKTSHYSYYLPISLGYHLASTAASDEDALKTLTYKVGYLFQAQDDFIDCYAQESVAGKSSCDIDEGKCTWITCRLLEKIADDPQKKSTFLEHFGQADPTHTKAAKSIIDEAGIRDDFLRFRSAMAEKLHSDIDSLREMDQIRSLLHSAVEGIVKDARTV